MSTNREASIIDALNDLAEFLKIKTPDNAGYMASELLKYSNEIIEATIERLKRWKKKSFPTFGDIEEIAIEEDRKEVKTEYADWQVEFAKTFNMPVSQFVKLHYNDLSDYQQKLLKVHYDIMLPEEKRELFKEIREKSLSNYEILQAAGRGKH